MCCVQEKLSALIEVLILNAITHECSKHFQTSSALIYSRLEIMHSAAVLTRVILIDKQNFSGSTLHIGERLQRDVREEEKKEYNDK